VTVYRVNVNLDKSLQLRLLVEHTDAAISVDVQ